MLLIGVNICKAKNILESFKNRSRVMKKIYSKKEWDSILQFSSKRQNKIEEIPGWIRVLYFIGFVFCFYVFLQTL